jgi:hypothetical protein
VCVRVCVCVCVCVPCSVHVAGTSVLKDHESVSCQHQHQCFQLSRRLSCGKAFYCRNRIGKLVQKDTHTHKCGRGQGENKREGEQLGTETRVKRLGAFHNSSEVRQIEA